METMQPMVLDFKKEIKWQEERIHEVFVSMQELLDNAPDNEDDFKTEMEEILKQGNNRFVDMVSFAEAAHKQIFGDK
jgi:hypothetical protein